MAHLASLALIPLGTDGWNSGFFCGVGDLEVEGHHGDKQSRQVLGTPSMWITPWHPTWNLSLSCHTQHGMDTALAD